MWSAGLYQRCRRGGRAAGRDRGRAGEPAPPWPRRHRGGASSTRTSSSRTSACRSSTSSSATSRSRTRRRARRRALPADLQRRDLQLHRAAPAADRRVRRRVRHQGDAEVVVAGYHYWGEAVLDRLRGMFAFLIWDRRAAQAFGARDPFGIKPLHYLRTPDGLYFASEKKALLPFAPGRARGDAGLNTANLSHYLTLQYVPEPDTLHYGISRIGSGECLTYRPAARCATRRYYRAKFHPTPVGQPGGAVPADPGHAARERAPAHALGRAGGRVPVLGHRLDRGGGAGPRVQPEHPDLHCRATTCPATRRSRWPRSRPSTWGSPRSRPRSGRQDMMDALPKIVWHLDDPVADPALVPLYFVAKKAAEHVTVVLSGEGADEFFGGYTIYREPLSLAGVNGLPTPVQTRAAGGVEGDPGGREGQELPRARHDPAGGALLRQRAHLHRGGEAAAAAPLRPDGALHRRHRAALRRGRRSSTTSPRCSTSTSTPGCAATSWSRPTGCRWRTRWSCGCRSWTRRSSRSPPACRST